MDEASVREHAEAHGRAVVAGDLRTAGADLTEKGREAAGSVMPQLPRPATSSEIVGAEESGDEWIVRILYRGEDKETTVESRWAESDGRPKIVDLKVV